MQKLLYNYKCCDIDSVEARGCYKRFVGFPWSECQVMKLATSHCTVKLKILLEVDSVCFKTK